MNSNARETIADIVTRGGYTAIPISNDNVEALEDADNVIAYLWNRADDPEVQRSVTIAIFNAHDEPKSEAATTALLTQLLGPRQENDDER